MKSKYTIPRYLGLSKHKTFKKSNYYQIAFSKRLQKNLMVYNKEQNLIKGILTNTLTESQERKVQPLINSGILKKDFKKESPKEFQRYDRHMLFYQSYDLDAIKTQKILSTKKIALLGMGGIGNWVSLNLIGSGFKEIRLIDFDVIELSNLTRQVLFSENDIGKLKVQRASEVLIKKNSQTVITPLNIKANGVKSLESALLNIDFVIVSADRPERVHDWVNKICVKNKIPYLNIGYRDSEGVVGPLTIPGKTSCYQCFKTSQHLKSNSSVLKLWNKNYQAPSFGPLNSFVSSIGSIELIKYFTHFGACQSLDTELSVNPVTLVIKKTKYKRDKTCKCCGSL